MVECQISEQVPVPGGIVGNRDIYAIHHRVRRCKFGLGDVTQISRYGLIGQMIIVVVDVECEIMKHHPVMHHKLGSHFIIRTFYRLQAIEVNAAAVAVIGPKIIVRGILIRLGITGAPRRFKWVA